VLDRFLDWLRLSGRTDWDVEHDEVLPARPPQPKPIPAGLDPRVADLVRAAGLKSLYSHQADTIDLCLQGKDVVLATSTASGKTLAYQCAVLDRLVRDPNARGLFLFPLKALERDQRDAFMNLAEGTGITAAVYDGDTPEAERRKIKSKPPRVLITNPDMLHMGLLAYHDTWKEFFSNLSHVVLDEVHTYKGIFGSHISQVLMRMRRVCKVYGSNPQFIACSATVSNPGELVSRLIGREVSVVDQSGAPSSRRHFVFLNPVLSPYTVASRLFVKALESGLKTIVFTRARKITELITTWVMRDSPHLRHRISSYRAGFLPEERREIETKLFSGQMDGVISTSALEMGIDVGGLDLCILVGYPGTVINTWQRGGRVGRAKRPSAIVMIAGNDALDQYFLHNPKDFFGRNCEEAILDPLNKEVLKRHIPCAAAETPILPEEEWTKSPEVASVLEELEEMGALFRSRENGPLHSTNRRPQREVDLRGIGHSFPIFLEDRKTLIGNSSGIRAFTECHEGAVYLHRAKQYLVTKLDLERQNVVVKPGTLDYYTRALSEKDTEILGAPIRAREFPGFTVQEARLKVTERIIAYEKRKTSGQELIGLVDLELPPIHFETVGIWIEIPDSAKDAIQKMGLHFMGGIHAMEHAAISMFPLFALCDRDDIGGISTPQHEQVCRAAVFIYDGHPGGVGLSHRAFDVIEELLQKTKRLVEDCPCEEGCPSCIHSPKCGSGNKPLDKQACLKTLEFLLDPKKAASPKVIRRKKSEPGSIAPDKLLKGSLESRSVPRTKESRHIGVEEVPGVSQTATPGKRKSPAVIFPDLNASARRPKDHSNTGHPPLAPPVKGGDLARAANTSVVQSPSSRDVDVHYGVVPVSPAPLPCGADFPVRGQAGKSALQRDERQGELSSESGVSSQRVVVFDLETQKLAHEVGGWGNIRKMRLSLGVAHSQEEGFRTFTEDNVSELINMLKSADLVVGFNQMGFDYEVLTAYTRENLRALPNLDILAVVKNTLGFRLALDHLAQFTLGKKKSGDGTMAASWFKEGKMDLLQKYCQDDVAITRDLYEYGRKNGFLLYQQKGGNVAKVSVDWPASVK
jgi:DEAD/DEAH box helicase domain-containing protein